jgi:hypothetical protein
MKHVKLFEAFINESSTLSTIGATPSQVSAIHKSSQIHLISHDNEYEKISTKAEAKKKLMDGGSKVTIVAFDKDGNISAITRRNNRINNADVYDIVTYDKNGKLVNTNDDYGMNAAKVIKELGKAKDIYYTNTGAFTKSARGRKRQKDANQTKFEIENAIEGIIEAAYTKIESKYNKLYQDIKLEATKAMMNDDYVTAEKLLDIISPKANFYGAKRKPRELKDLMRRPFRSLAYDAKSIMIERAKLVIRVNSLENIDGELDVANYKQIARQEMIKIYNEVFDKFNNIVKSYKG